MAFISKSFIWLNLRIFKIRGVKQSNLCFRKIRVVARWIERVLDKAGPSEQAIALY